MTDHQDLVIEPLSSDHDRPGFTCNVDSLDNYLRKQAKQDIKRRISRVFVATTPEYPSTIVGYYTLSTLSIELSQLSEVLAGKLPRQPVPAALIGRLAVAQHAQGQGVGKMLLMDAIKRTLRVSDEIAIYAIVVDAIDVHAKSFYQQYGFLSLSSKSRRLYLPLKSF